jgi:hypothetical protein
LILHFCKIIFSFFIFRVLISLPIAFFCFFYFVSFLLLQQFSYKKQFVENELLDNSLNRLI